MPRLHAAKRQRIAIRAECFTKPAARYIQSCLFPVRATIEECNRKRALRLRSADTSNDAGVQRT